MTRLSTFAIITALAVPAFASGQVADTAVAVVPGIMERIARHDDMLRGMTPQPLGNPALRQWEQGFSYSLISAGGMYPGTGR